ncbi:type I restriction endonuclease subunit R [Desulfosudis oleivorans]|uniref:Type III restriction protein res subunit n=1 Tax=Desulfosudis oleivorans (strain DSM 6200 / JCM 39069 / Hxd3) TaxID=96561 RepID=A8ZTW7_DESOH|nr:type I restriction-modification enzyme R subunit C-terminal domain-containing protein [Desulfosudis oleivorans]ABW67900.1 type III restriction protein res subunit [Desulfosudis oleivorans Hxd3]
MTESERTTRKKRIDTRLSSSLLNWTIIHNDDVTDQSLLTHHAVEEYSTKTGPADYALFVDGKLLGIIEAKKIAVGAGNVLEQAKRYSKGAPDSIGDWRGYKVPFLYSTNGELIFHLDVRNNQNTACRLIDFHSPRALLDKFNRDTQSAEAWLAEKPIEDITRLRPYQKEAIAAIETAIGNGKKTMLVAMATGTGKTFTLVSSIYRLLKSGYARRILFLVDRRSLAAQAVQAISSFETPEGLKLDNAYEVYSQKFRRDDFDDENNFDPKVLPEAYLTDPQEKHTFIYVSTIQRMSINLLGKEAVGDFEYEVDAGKLDIPIHAFDVIIADECHRGYSARETGRWKYVLDYFDAVKIGLTATPATHTLAMFKHKVFSYSTEQAVLDGFLVDYEAVKIKSGIHINGAFLKEGELVGVIDRESGAEKLDELEDEREFVATEIEVKITSPDSIKKIISALKKYTDEHEKENNRFPKTLIFAVNDLPHVSHADEIVKTCKEVYGRGDDFVMKITGSPTVDRPLQKIRQFRNRPEPNIVVTVDMLTTGVDIPAIEMVVFMRMVKSRILWVQMLGRGTRLCEEIHKEKFTIFDCFDGSLIKYFKDATDFNVSLQREATPLSEIIEAIYDNQDREYNINRLIKRLRRIEKNMGAEAREAFTKYIPAGDMKAFADRLKDNLAEQFTETMKLLRDKDFQDLLLNYPRPKKVFFKGYDIVDTVEHEVMFRVGGDYQKPEDYLKLFEEFVRRNPEHIDAIDILLSRPKQWGTDALDELRKQLRQSDFSEKDLQRGHALVYKKPLADIISMIKHASDYDVPILTAAERVDAAVEKIVRNHDFNDDQRAWLAYIKEHLIENLAIAEEDFALMPVFERQGGIGAARRVFGDRFEPLICELNEALAA